MTVNDTANSNVDKAVDRFVAGRHPVNVGHLVMGIAFLGLVVVWAIIQTDARRGRRRALAAAGAVGPRRHRRPARHDPVRLEVRPNRYGNSQSGWVDTRDDLREDDTAI